MNNMINLDFISIKSFCMSQGTIKKMERQATDKEKLFTNYVSGKGSRIYKELLQFNRKINNPV